MQTRIEVTNHEEADLLRRGLADPEVRAFVKVIGALSKLPSERAQRRVLEFVADSIDEARANDSTY